MRANTEKDFWKQVIKTKTCWNFRKTPSRRYGQFMVRRKNHLAHRYSWELLRGKIPEGLTIDHLCKNTFCVNPDHLDVVTRGINTLRGDGPSAINKRRNQCKNGHKFTFENTKIEKDGHRKCKQCHRDFARNIWRFKNPGRPRRVH